MTVIIVCVNYLKTVKSDEALDETIHFGIRCAYVGLQVFLVIGGLVLLGFLGLLLVE